VADHTTTTSITLRPGAVVEGRSGKALRALVGLSGAALEGVENGRGRGEIKSLSLVDERSLGDAFRVRLITLAGGDWRLDGVDVRGAYHGGIYVESRTDVEIRGLTGSGCNWGELVVVGSGCRVDVDGGVFNYLNDEIETVADGGSTRSYRNLTLNYLDVTTVNLTVGSVELVSVDVATQLALHSVVVLDATDCDWSTAALEIVQPGATNLVRVGLGPSPLIRFQTDARLHEDQSIALEDCSLAGALRVRSRGTIDFVGACTGPADPEPWVVIDAVEVPAIGHDITVKVNGVTVATLDGTAQTWRPST